MVVVVRTLCGFSSLYVFRLFYLNSVYWLSSKFIHTMYAICFFLFSSLWACSHRGSRATKINETEIIIGDTRRRKKTAHTTVKHNYKKKYVNRFTFFFCFSFASLLFVVRSVEFESSWVELCESCYLVTVYSIYLLLVFQV